MPEPMSWGMAEDTRLRYVCSVCYGDLIRKDAPGEKGKYILVCENGCHESGEPAGYVTKRWAGRQMTEAEQNYNKARFALRGAVPWMQAKTGKTEDEINTLLGFA